MWWAWILLLGFTSYASYQLGRRWERGRQEIQREKAAEAYQQRGTIRLNTIRFRR